MLRFIQNTRLIQRLKLDFNTSNVTVHRKDPAFWIVSTFISIHPMLRFIDGSARTIGQGSGISIHPMLRFIQTTRSADMSTTCISIHPMLRFIKMSGEGLAGGFEFQYIQCYGSSRRHNPTWYRCRISIHPMLRFIIATIANVTKTFKFQYIQCYGSSPALRSERLAHGISIHPMLRFIAWTTTP